MILKKTCGFLYHKQPQFGLLNSVRCFGFDENGHLKDKKSVLLDMHLRPPRRKYERLHPNTQKYIEDITQEPVPLKYKLQDVEVPHGYFPPIGGTENQPFQVQRTKSGNLPVYRDYKNRRNIKLTEVRLVTGNVKVRLFFVEQKLGVL